jgi:hypothetical protein
MLENWADAISNEAKVYTAKKDKALQGVCLSLVVFKEGAISSTNFHSSVEPTANQEVQVWLHNYPEEYECKEEDGTKKNFKFQENVAFIVLRVVSEKAKAVQGRKAAVVTLSDAMKGLSI